MAGSRRNYKAMLTPKLKQSARELEAGRGDAYERCVRKGGDPAVDLAIAQGELRDRGARFPAPAPAPAPAARESYAELVERIQAIAGLNWRQASAVAVEFPEGQAPDRAQIIRRAEALGYQPRSDK